jgi:hypothetical protein
LKSIISRFRSVGLSLPNSFFVVVCYSSTLLLKHNLFFVKPEVGRCCPFPAQKNGGEIFAQVKAGHS